MLLYVNLYKHTVNPKL